jgi:hypothetical protein
LQHHTLDAFTGSAMEQWKTLTPQGVERMGDQNTGISSTACSLPGS